MTDIASLVIEVDARQPKQAATELDKLAAAGTRVQGSTNAMGQTWVRASSEAGRLRMAEERARIEAVKLAASHNTAAAAARNLEAGQRAVAGATGQSRAGMQQLGYQLGDAATMFSLGARPAQIFASQIGQITQAVQLMAGGTSRFAAFLGGPWGIALSVGAIVLAPLVSKLFEGSTAADDMREAGIRLSESMTGLADSQAALDEALGRTIGQYRELRLAALDAGMAEVEAARAALEARRGELAFASAENEIANRDRGGPLMRLMGMGDTAGASAAVIEASTELNEQSTALNQATARLARVMRGEDGASDRSSGRSTRERVDPAIAALREQTEATEQYIQSLTEEAARLSMNSAEIRQREVELQRGAAIEAGVAQTIIDGIDAANAAREEAFSDQQRREAAQRETRAQANFEANTIRPLRDELALLGLVGPARELAALALEEEAFKADLVRQGVTDVNAAWATYLDLQTQLINGESALERDAEAAKVLSQELQNLISGISKSGGVGNVIGAMLGLSTGNIGSIGGSIGQLLNLGVGTQTNANGDIVARTLGDELRGIFKLDGEFGQTMSTLLEGAGTGSLVGAAIFGKMDMGEQLGAALGAAAGEAAGNAIAGPVGGKLGAIIGTVLGKTIGDAFTSTPYGTAVLTGAGAASVSGKGKGRIDSATGLGGSVATALQDVADLLNGSVGGYNVSLGTVNDSYRVSASGMTGKLKGGDVKDFGQDSASAIAYAIADAIKDGAITGVSESVRALLGKGSDVQRQLDKAVKFQSVFDMLLEATDPVAFAMQEIANQFDDLRAIFDEAGASAAEYADLEKLLTLKRQEAVDAARQSKLDDLSDQFSLQIRLLQLMGNSSEALTAARILEVAGMKASLQPLQAMIYELEDARGVIEKFGPLGDSLRAFKQELIGGVGAASFGTIAARFRATASGASIGDATALGAFQADASAYLEAAKANASTSLEYQRALSEVLVGADKGIFAADTQVQMAQATIDAVVNQTNVLEQMRGEIRDANVQLASNTGALLRLWQRFEGEGLLVRTDPDTPLDTVAA